LYTRASQALLSQPGRVDPLLQSTPRDSSPSPFDIERFAAAFNRTFNGPFNLVAENRLMSHVAQSRKDARLASMFPSALSAFHEI